MRSDPINDLDGKYMDWRDANPHVYRMFKTFANDLAARGRRFGIGLLAERVRWEAHFAKDPNEDYKINNNYRAYLIRDLIDDMPQLAGLVSCRCVEEPETNDDP